MVNLRIKKLGGTKGIDMAHYCLNRFINNFVRAVRLKMVLRGSSFFEIVIEIIVT